MKSPKVSKLDLVREELRQLCLTQGPGTALPPVRELRETLGANQTTIALAVRDLEMEGILEVIPRKGVYVVEGAEATFEVLSLLGHNPNIPVTPDVMLGFQQELQEGETVTGATIIPPYPNSQSYFHQLQMRRTRGVALISYGFRQFPESLREANFIYELSERIPVVLTGKPDLLLDLDCVYSDCRPQLRRWMEEMYGQGVRRFGYLTNISDTVIYRERVEAFRDFLLERGLKLYPDHMPAIGPMEPPVLVEFQKVARLMSARPEVEAVIASSAHITYSLVTEAQRRGRVPGKDLHILSLCNSPEEVESIGPFVTALLADNRAAGRNALNLLRERLAGSLPAAPQTRRIPAKIIPPGNSGLLGTEENQAQSYAVTH
jgi:DNA-binding LacI/PurR family transcriptional regulator